MEVVFTLLCSNECNDKLGTRPAPTPRPRAFAHSELERFTATQHRSLLEMSQSVEYFVPAEEQDRSNFVQQR